MRRLNTHKMLRSFGWMILFSVVFFSPSFSLKIETDVFNLNACVETALKNNPNILASGFSVGQSQAAIKEARSGFYPTLSFNAAGSHSEFETGLAGSGTTDRENLSSGLSAHYTLFRGYKTIAAVNAAKANFQATEAQHLANRQELIIAVTETYYRLLQAERFVAVSEQSVERAKMHLNFSNARFKAGLANRSDVLKATVEHSDVRLALISAQNSRLLLRGQLNTLMGRAVYLPIRIIDDLETDTISLDSSSFDVENQFKKMMQTAFQRRAELRKIENQIKAQRANFQYARGDYFPNVSLDGSYGYSGEAFTDLYASSYIGISLNFPLFAGFSRSARMQQENLALQNLARQKESLRQQVSLEVWDAFLQVKKATEQIANSRIFYENALENRNIAEGEYREGLGSMLDVIDAQTALVNSEQTLIESLADYKISLAALDRTVGLNNVKEILK